jgi:hypothetical protein
MAKTITFKICSLSSPPPIQLGALQACDYVTTLLLPVAEL